MSTVVKRTFSLTREQAKFIDSKVADGSYASGSEVVREGIREMQEDQVIMERWLRDEVLPAVREHEKDPDSARPADEVFDEILAELRGMETQPRKRA
jgi:antitoxin ParD1/3/4